MLRTQVCQSRPYKLFLNGRYGTYGLAVIEIAVICLSIALLVGKRKQNYFGLKS